MTNIEKIAKAIRTLPPSPIGLFAAGIRSLQIPASIQSYKFRLHLYYERNQVLTKVQTDQDWNVNYLLLS